MGAPLPATEPSLSATFCSSPSTRGLLEEQTHPALRKGYLRSLWSGSGAARLQLRVGAAGSAERP